MSLLVVSQVQKSFGADTILDGVSFRLEWGSKLGLVGRNGCGKTTLLRILTGQMEADRGSVACSPSVRTGYLRQEQMVEHGWTVYQEAEDAFAPVLQMEARLRELEKTMSAEHHLLDDVMAEYGALRDRFEAMGGFDNLRDIRQVLKRMGFGDEDIDKPTSRLSGGEKTRLALAKLLLSAPDVLLLDEPTNHLDLGATEWLEGFLREFGGAVLVVSHDRTFLNRVVTSTAELDRAKLTVYTGNFDAFWKQRAERRLRQAEQFEREQKEIVRLDEFFEKWKNTPSKRSQAVMRKRWADRIRANATERPTGGSASMQAKVAPHIRSGNEVIIVERLTKRFGDRTLFADLSLLVNRGSRIGVVGPNGCGKSTLARILLGLEPGTSGEARFGANVTVGYFAQEASTLDLDATAIENMMDVAEMTPGEARNHLGKFLLTGDDVFRQVRALSGGEKNKLALAQLAYARPNLLILDEPTNHLDLDSREALGEMLLAYPGTLVLVSHDRYLLDQVTTSTLAFSGGTAKLVDVPYSKYREGGGTSAPRPTVTPRNGSGGQTANALTQGMNSHQLSKERRKACADVKKLEESVSLNEDWVKRIEEALGSPMPGDDAVALAQDYVRAQGELEAAMIAWEQAVAHAEGVGAQV